MRVRAVLCLSLAFSASPALAQQGWDAVGSLMQQAFQTNSEWDSSYWLPDRIDPLQAREAIGVAYPVVTGAAGNTTIVVGYFVRSGNAFVYAGRIEGMFGHNPRAARFLPDRIEVITTMPLPGEPRCCPTGTARWSIDRVTRQTVRIE